MNTPSSSHFQEPSYLSILLVDDDHDDQFFFKEALSHVEPQINLSIANNHKEASVYLRVHIPHFIFLDINMPIVNGKDCLKYIRANKKFDEVHVIMLTTSSNEKDVDECYSLGANLYVPKPLSTFEHATIIRKIIKLHNENKLRNISREKFVFELNNDGSRNY